MEFRDWCFERASSKIKLGMLILSLAYIFIPIIGMLTWSSVPFTIYNILPFLLWCLQINFKHRSSADTCVFAFFVICSLVFCSLVNYGVNPSEENFKYVSAVITTTSLIAVILPFYFIVILGILSASMYTLIVAYLNLGNLICNVVWVIFIYCFYILVAIIYEKEMRKLWALEIGNKKRINFDFLTGAKTRCYFQENIVEEDGKIATSYGVLAMIDIDFFKKFNDEYGHDKGDEVLTKLCSTIQYNLSKSDSLIRWGGEEFLILFRCKEMPIIIERLQIIQYQLDSYGIQISCGLTPVNNCLNALDNIKIADNLLYEAKNTGRNKIVTNEGLSFAH